MADYTPGAGARTLRWVEGMRNDDGCLLIGIDADGLLFFDGYDEWQNPQGFTPDLADRATFLLALDAAEARGANPVPVGTVGSTMSPGAMRKLLLWLDPELKATVIEALDRALYQTRERA